MAGLIVNTGLDYLDNNAITGVVSGWKVYLYTSNTTPSNTSVIGDFTLMSSVGIVFQTPGFTVNSASAGAKTIVSTLMNFISNAASGLSLYGYIVVDASGSILIGAEKFSGGPYAITAAGYGVQLTVTLTDQNT